MSLTISTYVLTLSFFFFFFEEELRYDSTNKKIDTKVPGKEKKKKTNKHKYKETSNNFDHKHYSA